MTSRFQLAQARHIVPVRPCAARSMGVAWAGGGASWSAHLLGSISFAAFACGMTSGPMSMRRSSRLGESGESALGRIDMANVYLISCRDAGVDCEVRRVVSGVPLSSCSRRVRSTAAPRLCTDRLGVSSRAVLPKGAGRCPHEPFERTAERGLGFVAESCRHFGDG
jgi:hypothetical protein